MSHKTVMWLQLSFYLQMLVIKLQAEVAFVSQAPRQSIHTVIFGLRF